MRRALAAAALLALALVGCTDDAQSPTSTTSSPPPTGQTSTTPTSTTSDPADEPPVLPDAAKAQTTAGAKAFVAHFADLVNFAWLNLDSTVLTRVSNEQCKVCRSAARSIDRTAQNGGYQHGGEWRLKSVKLIPDSYPNQVAMLVTIHVADGKYRKSATAKAQEIVADTFTDEFKLVWTKSGWKILDLRST